MYACNSCGAPASLESDILTRSCECDAPVGANMTSGLHGKGGCGASTDPRPKAILLFKAVLDKLNAAR